MCTCHPVDRRSLLRAGAGLVTVGALATFEPAVAGETRRKVFTGEFTSPDTADWHYQPFKVPRGVTAIEVEYDYEPTDTGLGISYNVVDIGIFDPSGHGLGNAKGFRGWSGGARRSFRISRTRATPGYLAGPITPGRWAILLGPYLITPPGTPWKVIVTLHFGKRGPKFVPQPAPQAVPRTGPGWYRGDLHLHTVHSDGKRTQPQLVRAAREAGLDFIGSSDHNTSSATYTWGRHTPSDFLVINGEEVTTRSGHWLAMGLPPMTWIDWRFRAEDGQLDRFSDQVRALGGIAIAAHPFNPVPSIRWGHGYDYAGIDAIEAWNGPWTGDDQSTVEHWHKLLVAGRFLPVVGNSDSHTESQAVGLAQTIVRLPTLSAAAVVAAVRGGHAWIAESSGVELTFEATWGETTVSCGDHLGAGPGDVVDVRLVASGVPGAVAQVRGPAGVLAGGLADDTGQVKVEVQVPVASAAFVRAEVRRPDGVVVSPVDDMPAAQMVAMTNPIFLGGA
jgi:predicted metal-dependent phosphoesterase TrpH